MAEREPSPQRSGPEWLTLGQAATYLGVAQSTMRKWADVKRMPAITTPGGHRRFRRADLDAFLEQSTLGGSTAAPSPLVLIVDDDDGVREFVRASLEPEGYTVREAANVAEGLAALDEQPPDLILLDVMMPEVDGWEMLRMVRQRHGVGATPVIMFSGQVDESAIPEAEAEAVEAFIGKPFDPQQLIETTKQFLPAQ